MVRSGRLVAAHGLEGDAHAGPGLRQVSLLAIEDIERFEHAVKDDHIDLHPGVFAENITTEGVGLSGIKVGDRLAVGGEAVLRVTQIGKVCHDGCEIRKKTGVCLMPTSGIFAVVEEGGEIRLRDSVRLLRAKKTFWPWSKT
ncbi:MAG: MOSC domain-containing protein [Candidatus Omnitrophica bacterium]|nr:MOSC domain-containing protein [Candidatus Omnitrophota bacterium]